MEPIRGLLHLCDPTTPFHSLTRSPNTKDVTLVFNENERYIVQAQQALWKLRQRCSWVCVRAEGEASSIALSLAAQLPVDRLYLKDFRLFTPPASPLPRQLIRLRSFARHNLALIIAQLLVTGADERELRRLLRLYPGREICLTEAQVDPIAPWPSLQEKNLLIPGKCV